MLELLIILTLTEVVLVLAVLVSYLVRITASLRRTARLLAKVGFGVRAIETQAGAVAPAVTRINATLEDVAAAAPALIERAEQLAGPEVRR